MRGRGHRESNRTEFSLVLPNCITISTSPRSKLLLSNPKLVESAINANQGLLLKQLIHWAKILY